MAHFPHSHESVRAPRVTTSVPITIKTEHGHAVGVLHHFSDTGGVARLKQRITNQSFAELIISTGHGQITALVELLASAKHPEDQAFKFIAIDDSDHDRLRSLMKPGRA